MAAGMFGECVHCGATNPIGSRACQFCGSPLPTPEPVAAPLPPPPPDTFHLVTASEETPSAGGTVLLVVGVLLVVFGVILLAVASGVHQAVESFNQACSQNPLCQPESDPSGAMTGGGVILLIVGILMAIIGYAMRTG